MELVLVRHALPVRIDASPDGRPADPGLAQRGREQAARVLGALQHDHVAALYSSPATRARETAAPVAFRNRVVAAVEAIVSRHPGERVVLFTHSGTINAYCGHVLGQQRALWFAPDYASVTRLGAARDGRRGVVSLNETTHVRDLLAQA